MKKTVMGMILMALAAAVCLFALRDAPRGSRAVYAATGRENAYATPPPPQGTIQVNEAEMEDLTQLPGVGETLAQAILDERELHGPYHYPEDLMAAKGIGPAKLDGFRDLLNLD